MNYFFKNKDIQEKGQTLIETVVAIFIMVMGVTAAVGLANFALTSSTNVVNQVLGMGLAREGLEAVKNMRDTNWLVLGTPDDNCTNLIADPSGNTKDGLCYKKWLQPPGSPGNQKGYDILPQGANNTYTLSFTNDPSKDFWVLNKVNASPASNFLLGLDTTNSVAQGFYYPSAPPAAGTKFYRSILIEPLTASQLPSGSDQSTYVRLTSQVWWNGKKCPSVSWPGAGSCGVQLQMLLTNWKNY